MTVAKKVFNKDAQYVEVKHIKFRSNVLKDLTLQELQEIYPNVPVQLLPSYRTRGGMYCPHNPFGAGAIRRMQAKYKKGALKYMARFSKHLRSEKFGEICDDVITPDLIAARLYGIIMNDDEKSEVVLKAISEVNKYTMVPSQAQEIKHEVTDTFGGDERARLAEIVAKAKVGE